MSTSERGCRVRRSGAGAGRPVVVAIGLLVAAVPAWGGKVETWKQDTAGAFAQGREESVIVAEPGRVRLARVLAPTAPIDAARVWDLAQGRDGAIHAATGDAGKVFRRQGDEGAWELAYDAEDGQALSLASAPDGRLYLGTGPSGQVVELSDPQRPATRPGPTVQYIWDLAVDAEGALHAATGPTGQLWKRAPGGAWSLLLDSKHDHLLCLAIGKDGSVYAGSDGEGLIYRVARDGKVSVVLDAPQSEVRSLLVGADGALYAGTATAATTSGGQSRGTSSTAVTPRRAVRLASQERATNPPGIARPRATAAGENLVYRIGPDGAAREVYRAKALMNALAWSNGNVLVGTGPEGRLVELIEGGREVNPMARLDHGQLLALLAGPDGSVLIGAADPGGVARLRPSYATSGTLTSEVFDAKLLSRFGAVTWRADQPAGTAVAVQLRSGNVEGPDETWSAWSGPMTDPSSARAGVPPGRFVQYRVTLKAEMPGVTPELRSIAVRYQSLNLAPELTRISVPDLNEADGATRQTRLTLRWESSDPNGDDLTYELHVRKDGWPSWVALGERPLTEKSYDWDTTALPAGTYRARVVASDRPSNAPEDALTRELVSEPFLVDHLPPRVALRLEGRTAKAELRDEHTRIVSAAYALDGRDWVPLFPEDGLFDTAAETARITLDDLKPGVHVLMVRTTDAAGNTGSTDAVFEAR